MTSARCSLAVFAVALPYNDRFSFDRVIHDSQRQRPVANALSDMIDLSSKRGPPRAKGRHLVPT